VAGSYKRNSYFPYLHRVGTVIITTPASSFSIAPMCMLLLLTLTVSGCFDQRGRDAPANLKNDEIYNAVARITEITSLSPVKHEPERDQRAIAIIALGRQAGPYLVDKITDRSASQVAELFQYTIGDVALVLLDRIYRPPGWPFPDNSERMLQRFGDYRDYVEFVNVPGARARLQQSWKRYIEQH
jgi:hypothetical protein